MLNSPQNHQAAAMGQSRSQRDCPGTLWVLLGSLLTAALLGNAFLARWPGASPAVAASAGTPTARAEPGSVASRFPRRNIEDIRVGERVLAHDPNANGSFDGVPTAVNPVTWKRLRLFAESRLLDGSPDDVHVETLQPPEWLRENHVAVGAQVPLPLDLVEMGLPPDLRARVVSIEPCPEIARGNGAVVLTTVNHLNGSVLDIDLLGPDGRFEALGVTATHRVWSATRRSWIPAGSLQEGESLLGVDGPVVVACVTKRPSSHRVYNLTVEKRHVYNVSTYGALVHNNDCTVFRGGPYNEMTKPANDGLQGHHVISRKAMEGTDLDPERMPAVTVPLSDHIQTAASAKGRSDWINRQAELLKAGKLDEAFLMGAEDLVDEFGDRYKEAILQAIDVGYPRRRSP